VIDGRPLKGSLSAQTIINKKIAIAKAKANNNKPSKPTHEHSRWELPTAATGQMI